MTPTATESRDAASRGRSAGAPWRWIGCFVLLGVLLRAVLLALAVPVDIQSDEANYVYLALAGERFGIYLDQHRYFWPPGYPWLMTQALHAWGIDGLNVIRGVQVALSGVIGATTMLFAWRLFSRRAAVVAGALWAIDVPLAAYTHFLWTETLFLALLLPALWHLLVAFDRGEAGAGGSMTPRLLASGVLFGAALYVKELPLFLVPLLGAVIGVRTYGLGLGAGEALRRATLVPLATLVVVLPWTLRNQEVYDRTLIAGATLGENVFIGVNARAMNFDIVALRKRRADLGLLPVESLARPAFTAPPAGAVPRPGEDPAEAASYGWERVSEEPHAIDRHGVQMRRGMAYALEHPVWTVRTRIKKWSDLVTPLSFFTRHHALRNYPEDGALAGWLRVPLVVLALGMSTLTMLLGAAGFFLTLRRGPGRALVTTVFGYVALTSLLVAMSRFRLPLEPFLLALTAGFLAHGLQERSIPRLVGLATTLLTLVGLWWVSWPETLAAAVMALGVDG